MRETSVLFPPKQTKLQRSASKQKTVGLINGPPSKEYCTTAATMLPMLTKHRWQSEVIKVAAKKDRD